MKNIVILYCSISFLVVFCTAFENVDKNDTDQTGSQIQDVNEHPNWELIDKEHCGDAVSDRIIGGHNATVGQYAWIARLGYSSTRKYEEKIQFSCGGSLITACWVLSAAHCVIELPKFMYLSGIRLGEFNTDTEVDCNEDICADPTQDFRPEQILIHRNYGNTLFKNDISLIKLHKEAEITQWVYPICLPYKNLLTKNITGEQAEVAGWGITDIDVDQDSKILQTVTLPIVEVPRCQKSFRGKALIDHKQLCVGGVKGEDSCGGDSGGPLMKIDSVTSPKYYVFGVVSFGSKYCGKKTTPAVYTSIVEYLGWILDNITPCCTHKGKSKHD